MRKIALLLVVISMGVLFAGCDDDMKERKERQWNYVIVQITQEAFESGHVYTPADFPDVDCKSIEVRYPGERWLQINLRNYGVKRVQTAIAILKQHPDIEYVEEIYDISF